MKTLNGKRLADFNSRPKCFDQPVEVYGHEGARLALAISSETGAGGVPVAEQLAVYLEERAPTRDLPWRMFNKNLMLRVLEDHHLPARVAKFLGEDTHNPVDEFMDELLGLHPPTSVVVQRSIETVRKLALQGNVIFVGWGVNVITAPLGNVFHVRLIGSREKRIARIQERERLDRKLAIAFIERSDRGRERYVARYFHRQISDALLYDLVLNTDRFSEIELAHLIGDSALTRTLSLPPVRTVPVADRII